MSDTAATSLPPPVATPQTDTVRSAGPSPPEDDVYAVADGGESKTGRRDTTQLGTIGLALVLGGLGFVNSIFWIAAMIVMAITFGIILAERRGATAKSGVIPEIIAAVVHEAKDISNAASWDCDRSEDDRSTGKDEDKTTAADIPLPSGDSYRGSHTLAEPNPSRPASAVLEHNRENGSGHGEARDLDEPTGVPGGMTTVMSDHQPTGDEPVAADRVEDSPGWPVRSNPPQLRQRRKRASKSMRNRRPRPGGGSVGPPASMGRALGAWSGRLIVSADNVAAHTPLLRPARKSLYTLATSVSRKIVELGAAETNDPHT
jgi:hypothetical protein